MQALHHPAISGTANRSSRPRNYLRTTDTEPASEVLNYSPADGAAATAFPCANEISLFHMALPKTFRIFNLNLVRFGLIACLNRRTNWWFDGERGDWFRDRKRHLLSLRALEFAAPVEVSG